MPDIPVNTTEDMPAVAGTWNPDGPSVNAYCSVQDVFAAALSVDWEPIIRKINNIKALMGDDAMTVPDYIANRLIPAVESEVDGYLKMTYKPTEITRAFDGNGTSIMTLPYTPITTLNFVNIYTIPGVKVVQLNKPRYVNSLGAFDDDAYWAGCDVLVHSELGKLFIPPKAVEVSGFPLWTWTFVDGIMNVEASWTHGFKSTEAIPYVFRNAVAELVAVRLLEISGGARMEGLASRKIGDATYTAGREKNMPYSDLMQVMTTRARTALVPFKGVF